MEKSDAFKIFAMVGDRGSISGAARALGESKATVSRAVSRLESLYNVRLVERTTRQITLTEVGSVLHARCIRIREEMEDVDAEIATYRNTPAGILRIGCTSDIAKTLLTPNLHEFLDLYPEIDVRVRVGERLLPEPNILDVVLHCGWLSDSRLTARKIAEVQNVLVASREYVRANGMPASPDELEGHAIIGNFYLDAAAIEPGPLPAYVPRLEIFRGQERFTLPTYRRFLSTDHSQIFELVKHGRVIAPITGIWALPGLLSGELVRILPDYEISESPQFYALYLDRLASVPKLKIFLEFIEEIVQRLTKEWQPKADRLFPKQNLVLFSSTSLQNKNGA
ncbi:LysR family transcriptional regulator [Serratia proteamaculans]|uniref:LysR family transcriptional regulator n=1 Tax=Serratia proteamaculans TaxID=28151 RepID=UPI0021788C30|nr:LysR family transcriptional regulator [Serratia proteamaculans]CAI2034792.1 D-malate degradation protein R [Serratia proteamaculans]